MIHHHRPFWDDILSSSLLERFIIIPEGATFIIILKGQFFLSSQGTIHHHRLFGIIFYYRPFGMIFHHRPKGTIFLLSSQRDDSSSSSLWDNFFIIPKGRFFIIVSLG